MNNLFNNFIKKEDTTNKNTQDSEAVLVKTHVLELSKNLFSKKRIRRFRNH